MGKDRGWPIKCTLMGCTNRTKRPHHHHMYRGHPATYACACEHVDQPGTRPKEE